MARGWGSAWASFYELDNITSGSPVSYGGVTQFDDIVEDTAQWRRPLSGIGAGKVTLYAVNNWEQFAVPGRVCIVHKNVSGYSAVVSRAITVFLIEDIEPGVRGGMNTVALSGPGVESLLTKRPVFGPIGEETIHETTLQADAAAPRTTTLDEEAEAGSDIVVLVDDTGVDVDDEIRVRVGPANDGYWHVARVTGVEIAEAPAGTVQISPPLLVTAAAANSVEIRTAGLSVEGTANFATGQRVEITLDNTNTFETVIRRVDSPLSAIYIEEGLTSIASTGKAVKAYDYSRPTSEDVAQIMAYAPDWTMTYEVGSSGTAAGTAHEAGEQSVFDLLRTTAERTGEFFRYRILAAGLPTYRLDWRQTPDDSGVTLTMYAADEHGQQATDEDDIGKASIFSLRSRKTRRLVTRVYPLAGDGRISLAYCSEQAITNAVVDGFTVHVSDDFYEPDYVELTDSIGVHAIVESYPDISIAVGNADGLTAAADQLLLSAMRTLYQAASQFEYDIEAFVPSLIHPGQYVHIKNETGTEPASDVDNTFTVLETTERLVKGRPRTTLIVSNHTNYRRTPLQAFGNLVRSLVQGQRRITTRGGSAATAIVSGGGGGATDHGALTGLTDDDHPQYLRTDGGRTLTGNLAVAPGVTIDGVDLSTLPAGHDPVTALNHAITVTGQAVGLKLSSLPSGMAIREAAPNEGLTIYLNPAGSGLELTASGLAIAASFAGPGLALNSGTATVNTAAASGTAISGDTVAVVAASTGGLQLTSTGVGIKTPTTGGLQVDANGIAVKLPADSGLIKDTTGLYAIAPATLTATTTNSRALGTHAVTATDNAKTTTGTLLKGSAAGDLTARWLTADKVVTPLVETAAGALTLNPASALTINDGNLQFTGARSITTDTGSLTLSPAQTLVISPDDDVAQVGPTTTLKSAHAAVGVFPQTGWQIDYDGHGYFTSLLADELHVQSFIADLMRVKVGGEYIPESMALIRRDITIPAVGATAQLYVEDIPGWPNIPVFADGDWVMLRIVDRSGGGLVVASAWGQVTSYVDLGDGEQRWTYTTRVGTLAVGQTARAGDIALDYGKVGSSWYYVTVTDPGGPHAGFASWYGSYPGDNPEYWLRMGQLKGVSGTYERGFQTGKSNSSFTRLSELRNEIHGSRLSLYAGDGGKLQLSAVEVNFYRTGSQFSTLAPDGDGTAVNVETTGGTYYGTVDEGVSAPNHADYVANKANLSGSLFLTLGNPAAFSSIFRIDIRAAVKSTGLVNDTARLYGQVFASDEATPLTGEVLIIQRTINATTTLTVTAPHTGYGTGGADVTDWNGARLRLRWEYEINANEEAIRLDPAVPSLAVGNPLPTGMTTGGAGLWAGLESGAYRARIGDPLGARMTYDGNALRLVSGSTGAEIDLNPTAQSIALGNPLPTGVESGGGGFWVGLEGGAYKFRLGAVGGTALRYDGANLFLRNASGDKVIELNGSGDSYFAGPMTISSTGGIWQGTGTFAAPTTGLKIYNSGGIGRLATYNAGTVQIELGSTGELLAGAGRVRLNSAGMAFAGAGIAGGVSEIEWRTSGFGSLFGSLDGYYTPGGTGYLELKSFNPTNGVNMGAVRLDTLSNGVALLAHNGGFTDIILSAYYNTGSSKNQVKVNGELWVDGGIRAGYTLGTVNRGQMVSNFASQHSYNAIIMMDVGTVAHGMTSVVDTATYGALGKEVDADGGLKIIGASQGVIGTRLYGYGTGESTASTTAARAAVVLSGRKASGTGSATIGNTGNILTVDNNGTTRLIIKGNGDLLIDGTQSSYDDYDDVALLRAADLAQAGHDIDAGYGDWLAYNRADLEAAGLLDGTFVNVTRMQRLITGAIGQLAGRVKQLEETRG